MATDCEENASFSHCRAGSQEQHIAIVWGRYLATSSPKMDAIRPSV